MLSSPVNRMRPWLCGVLVLTFMASCATQASAQDDRRELIDSIIKELMKSEERRMEEKNNLGSLSPAAPAVKVDNSREIHTALASFTRDCDDLALALINDSRRIPGLSQLLPDVYQLRARSSILADKTAQGNDWSILLDDIKSVDRDWRAVSFKLSQLQGQGLSQQQTRLIGRLDQTSQTLINALNVRPQIDTYKLSQALASLKVDFQNLIEEIEYEITNSTDRNSLLIQGRQAQQQVNHMSLLVRDGADYNALIQEYGRFSQIWSPMLTKLQTYNNRYMERSLRRINESNTSIHEILWIPHEIDRQQLIYQTNLLKKDVDEFFSRTPLKLLISLPNSEYVLSTADAFYGVCENFADIVNRNGNREDMVDAFRYIEDSQAEFITTFKPIRSQAALNVLNAIDQHVGSLRGGLILEEQFDRTKAIELGASLQNLAEHLHMDTKLWLSHVNVNYKREAEASTARFSELAAAFHQQALTANNPSKLKTLSDGLYEQWRVVHSFISRSTNEDRAHLARLASHIGPNLIELQSLTQDAGTGPLAGSPFPGRN